MEVRTIGAVFGDDLRMHRLALGAARKFGIGTVIRIGVGRELGELTEQVGHVPQRFLAVGLMPGEHAPVLLSRRVHAQA
jgi:hypothetical protein